MTLFNRKPRRAAPPLTPTPLRVPPFGSIVQPRTDVTVPGKGVVATPRTPGRVVMDTAGILSPGSVFVQWHGGVTTAIPVDGLQVPWFEPTGNSARHSPAERRPPEPSRGRTMKRTVTEVIRDEPLNPNAATQYVASDRINPDGSRTRTVIIRDEPL